MQDTMDRQEQLIEKLQRQNQQLLTECALLRKSADRRDNDNKVPSAYPPETLTPGAADRPRRNEWSDEGNDRSSSSKKTHRYQTKDVDYGADPKRRTPPRGRPRRSSSADHRSPVRRSRSPHRHGVSSTGTSTRHRADRKWSDNEDTRISYSDSKSRSRQGRGTDRTTPRREAFQSFDTDDYENRPTFSPGTKFVAELSQVMELEPGYYAPLSIILDKHWERVAEIRKRHQWDG